MLILIIRGLIGLSFGYFLIGYILSFILYRPSQITLAERFILSFALSTGITTLIMFLLGVAFLNAITFLNVLLIESSLMVSGVLFNYWRTGNFRDFIIIFKSFNFNAILNLLKTPLQITLVSLIIILEFLVFFNALAIPIFVVYDCLMYFAPGGVIIYKTKNIISFPSNGSFHTFMGFNMHYFFVLLISWFYISTGVVCEPLARFITPLFNLMTIFSIGVFAKKLGSTHVNMLVSILLLLSTPLFTVRSYVCHDDIIAGFFVLVTLYFYYLSLNEMPGDSSTSYKHSITCGILMGIALSVKYTTLILIPSFLFFFLLELKKKNEKLLVFKKLALIGLFTFIFGASYFLYRWYSVGNPVWPALYRVFDGKYFFIVYKYEYAYGLSYTLRQFLSLQFYISLVIAFFSGLYYILPTLTILGMLNKRQKGISPLLKPLMIPLIVGYLFLWGSLSLSGLTMTYYFWTKHLLTIAPLMSLLTLNLKLAPDIGKLFRFSWNKKQFFHEIMPRLSSIFVVILLICQGYIAVSQGKLGMNFDILINQPTKEKALEQAYGERYFAWEYINNNTPENSCILSIDAASYYIERRFIWAGSPLVEGIYTNNLNKILQIIKQNGITHVFIEPWMKSERYWVESIFWKLLEEDIFSKVVFKQGDVVIYEIL